MKNLLLFLLFAVSIQGFAQFKTAYPDIPRIDVHVHKRGGGAEGFTAYLGLRDTILQVCGADVAMWIDLEQSPIDSMTELTNSRMMSAMCVYKPAVKGIIHKKDEVDKLLSKGYLGYKIWYGPPARQGKKEELNYEFMDHPDLDVVWGEIERQQLLITSMHIADPNGPIQWRTPWAADPVLYWRQIMAFERVMHKHPNLKVVMAHGAWLMTQDAQIDFLRYMLESYPNMNIDISATLNYNNLQSRENIRDFYMTYQDRIVFATDFTSIPSGSNRRWIAQTYFDFFRYLETGDVFGENQTSDKRKMHGLALSREVLEKIYYKNALRIYPHALKERMIKLGYKVDI